MPFLVSVLSFSKSKTHIALVRIRARQGAACVITGIALHSSCFFDRIGLLRVSIPFLGISSETCGIWSFEFCVLTV